MKRISIVSIFIILVSCGTQKSDLLFYPPVLAFAHRDVCIKPHIYRLLNDGLKELSLTQDCKILDGGKMLTEDGFLRFQDGIKEIEISCGDSIVKVEVVLQNGVNFFFKGSYDFQKGEGGGYGYDRLPDVIEGPPHGGGRYAGSLDVLSLGKGGKIDLFVNIYDADGPDFIIFENPFEIIGGGVYTEPAEVSVFSDSGKYTYQCDVQSGQGCAGINPVLYDGECQPSPLSADSGGDTFDLVDSGISFVREIEIKDLSSNTDHVDDKSGFDLDAIAILNPAPPENTDMEIEIKRASVDNLHAFSLMPVFKSNDVFFAPINFKCTPEGESDLPIYLLKDGASKEISCSYGELYLKSITLEP